MKQDPNAAALAGAIESTVHVAVEVSRSSRVAALHCPDAGGKISLHTVKPASTGELVRLIRRSRERVVGSSGRDARVLANHEASCGSFRLARNDGIKDAGTGNVVTADLVRVCGIGPDDAALLADEVFHRDFRNRRELGSWAGVEFLTG